MTEPVTDYTRKQIEAYRSRLTSLIQRGLDVRDALSADRSSAEAAANARAWQQDCGMTVNELSGGSKAHWLAREFSGAFLVSGSEAVAPDEIVQRLIGVLEQALASLSRDGAAEATVSPEASIPHRFDFVYNPELRPVLEKAYTDARHRFEQGDFVVALLTYSGILEAIITDALQHRISVGPQMPEMPGGEVSEWPFRTRLLLAEKSGLIGRGYARLPEVALRYRELDDASKATITERDARVTGQVLHVIMRDLNPGR